MLALIAGSAPAALAQETTNRTTQGVQPPESAAAELAQAGADAREDQGLPVLLITSVVATHPEGKPDEDLLRVTGVVSSRGWSAPRLVPTYGGPARDGVLDLELVATPPEQTAPADGFETVDAILELEGGSPYKAVRVRGSENALALDKLPGSAQADIKMQDCQDCIGKQFQGGDKPMVGLGAESLPHALRVLRPADGVHGAELDPNRLTLVLDANDTVVAAFWE
jgi:hypothetical protein